MSLSQRGTSTSAAVMRSVAAINGLLTLHLDTPLMTARVQYVAPTVAEKVRAIGAKPFHMMLENQSIH